jgi:predicted nucleotidyltransferase component of viral defense system
MISEAELRRQAARWSVDPMVVDLDYSLGWFLTALYGANEDAARLYFKGGTCLRKCYFGDYRFSEDLDFTATLRLDPDRLLHWVTQAAHWSAMRDGPNYEITTPRVETLQDAYGDETYQVRVYYRGPLQWGGSPRAIRLDVTRDETLVCPPETRALLHPYSDAEVLGAPAIICYALVEILAEKIRAIGGQRRFAISRDLYDIHHLIHSGVSLVDVVPLLSAKFEARGVDLAAMDVAQFTTRRAEFAEDWRRRISYLVQNAKALNFEEAWQTTLNVLQQIETRP